MGFRCRNANVAACSDEWRQMAKEAGKKIVELTIADWKPRDHITRENYINAIKYIMAIGGSTNSVLHMPAVAKQAGIDIEYDLFDQLSNQIPLISTIYPSHPT